MGRQRRRADEGDARVRARLKNLSGFPKVEQGHAEPYFTRLAERLEGQDVPVWDGELYLEYHRGTYTSQAGIKRANRKAEWLYHDAELLGSLASVLTGHAYPDLHEGWERLLLNQFRDILPGSSIRQVYENSARDFERIWGLGESALAGAKEALLAAASLPEDSVVVFNTLSWARDGLVSLPLEPLAGKMLADDEGNPLPHQVMAEAGEKRLLVYVPNVPPLGYRAYRLAKAPASAETSLQLSRDRIDTPFYRIALDAHGHISSLFDKRNAREVVPAGARGNVLQTFEDKPIAFDAWDIDIYYQEKMLEVDHLLSAEVEEAGPLRGVLRLRWRFYDSTITQHLTVYAHSPRLDFRTEVDWRQRQTLLKVAFPTTVRATRATYDIQFGSIERPTHWNTSWDWARFEVVGHKWADLSEGNYGVSLLNDCKYGYDVKDNVMRLTLIKSAVRPDALADKGRHVFTYSLLPHAGTWREGVIRQGYDLNAPLRSRYTPVQTGPSPAEFSFAKVDCESVIVETVKRAEEGDAYIVRLYEAKQYRHGAVTLHFGSRLVKAAECNLMEEVECPAAFEGNRLRFGIAPFEIKTFKVWFG